MATFRGQTVSANSSVSMDELRRWMADLVSAEIPNLTSWSEFLDQAGGSELAEIGSILAQRPATERGQLLQVFASFVDDPDWNIRDSIARLFGAIGDRRASSDLRRLLFDPEEPLVRYSALRALRSLGAAIDRDEMTLLTNDSSSIV